MKKILFASLACAFLLSCNRDNDDNSSSVVGKWKIIKEIVLSGKDKSQLESVTASGCEASNTYEFKSDNKFEFKLFSDFSGPCSLDETLIGTYNYNTSTKMISIVKSDGTSDNLEVYKLSNSELQSLDYNDEDYNGDGINDLYITVLAKQ